MFAIGYLILRLEVGHGLTISISMVDTIDATGPTPIEAVI